MRLRASIYEAGGRLTARSRGVSKSPDSSLDFSQMFCNLTGTLAATPPIRLSEFRAIRSLEHPISRLRDLTRSCGKTSVHLMNRGPGAVGVTLIGAVISPGKVMTCFGNCTSKWTGIGTVGQTGKFYSNWIQIVDFSARVTLNLIDDVGK